MGIFDEVENICRVQPYSKSKLETSVLSHSLMRFVTVFSVWKAYVTIFECDTLHDQFTRHRFCAMLASNRLLVVTQFTGIINYLSSL